MATLKDYRDKFKGQVVTLVGGAVTTVDYAELAATGTDNVVLINWALRIAPLFTRPQNRVYFVSWHWEVFHGLHELFAPKLVPVVYSYATPLVPAEIASRVVTYKPVNLLPREAYIHALKLWATRGQDFIDETGELISCCNSTLLALLFVWHGGCREINAVGMHDIGGIQASTYDPRLRAANAPSSSQNYVRDLEEFCEIMGIQLNYLGQR